MCSSAYRGRRVRGRRALFAAVSASLASASVGHAQISLTKTSNTNWTINNGPLMVVFDPSSENITSIKINANGTTSANILNPSGGQLDQEFSGTPFGSGAETFNSVVGPNNSYVDVWTNVASTGTTVNPVTYAFHYVLFANDPTIQVYETVSHASTDPATSVGQGQFLFRANPTLFPNLYQANTGPNNLAAVNTLNVPSTASNFSSVTAQAGRTVQNVTYDLTGSGLAGDNGTNFFTKYDYSTYNQFYQAETMYGSQYAVSAIIPNMETLTGGPTKQELAWTDPDILNLEFLSDHYGIDSGRSGYPGYAYTPTQGQTTNRLFGAYAFRVVPVNGETPAQLNQDAINSIPTIQSEENSNTELVASGYVPTNTNQRGSVQISAADSAGWSSNVNNNTVVLSQPGVNMQESTQGYQYWGQVSQNGQLTLNNVVPGDYRMTLYQLGQWGETRVDGVQVAAGQATVPQNVKFTPENFGSQPAVWTIGTPNRSANEFMNGHNATGADQRQYFGAYDYWAEEQALGTPGFVSYNATATTINGVAQPATNDPNKWIANQWKTFNPGLYDSSNGTTDEYANIAPAYVTAGGGPATYSGAPWQVHFTVTQAQENQGQYVVLSVAAAALNASLTVTLNGHAETWSYNNFPGPDDPDLRSGDAGFYQWAAFEFPTSDLNAAGVDDVMTFSVSQNEGVMYDALRMEITNTSANPTVTGWHDYTYINSSTSTAQNDALAINTLTWNNSGATGNGSNWDFNNQNWNTGLAAAVFSSGSNVVFNDANNGHYNVTLAAPVTPLSVLVNNSSGNYMISGGGSIGGSGTLAKYGTGSLTLNTVNNYTGGTFVNAGTLIAGINGAIGNGPVTINGGILQLGASTGLTQITSLTISGSGILDVNNNHVIINYGSGADPVASIAALLATGYNGGAWNGTGGIISSAAAATSGYGLGYADAADAGNPAGLASGTIEIKYTLLGDTDLNGIVNGIDFGVLAANFNQGVSRWDQGDFDYNRIVNGIDFGALAANFNQGASGAAATEALIAFAQANGLMADVPEPDCGMGLVMLSASFLARRVRKSAIAPKNIETILGNGVVANRDQASLRQPGF